VIARVQDRIRRNLLAGVELRRRVAADMSEGIARAACELTDRLARGGTVFFFGNGGSATQALHLAGEFTGRFKIERRPLPAVALGANAAEVTAIANDYSYEEVFSRPLQALVRRDDLAIGLSCSGSSPNVVRAIRVAKDAGACTVAMTGNGRGPRGGPVGEAADLALVVPSGITAEIQEIHLAIGHLLCELAEAGLSESGGERAGK
jgi:D-sedoheptulose 7-phosphate isomerase